MSNDADTSLHDIEAERSVLGAVLLVNETLADVAELVRSEDFARRSHGQIFEAMTELAAAGEPIDVITLSDALRRRGHLEDVGGAAYLSVLDATVPLSSRVSTYAEIVRSYAVRRRGLAASIEAAQVFREGGAAPEELVNRAQGAMLAVDTGRSAGTGEWVQSIVLRAYKRLEQRFESQSEVSGLRTGFAELDRMTAGLQNGDLVIVAGRPSMGKTSLAMNIAEDVAIGQGIPVVVFSLEMSRDALVDRMLASRARVDSQRLRTGRLLDSDFPKLARASDEVHRAPLYIEDDSGLTPLDMLARARRAAAKARQDGKSLGLIIVDYLQIARSARQTNSREQEVSDIARGLKHLARAMNVPVVALSQLSRKCEERADKRPMLSDLRESGAIEQDADVITFVYRDEVYDAETSQAGVAEIIIGKQRNGPTGTARLAFLRDFTRFEDIAEGHEAPPSRSAPPRSRRFAGSRAPAQRAYGTDE